MIINITKAAVAIFVFTLIGCFCAGYTANSTPEDTAVAPTVCRPELSTPAVEQVIDQTTTTNPTEPIILISEPLLFNNITYKTFYDIVQCDNFIVDINKYIQELEHAIKSEEYTKEAADTMQAEQTRLLGITKKVEADITKYTTWEQEYYYAAKTFLFLKQCGYNDVVACAIIGNMMIETSGGSLALNPTIYDPPRAYYGLCQWSVYYKPFMADKTFEEQLEYLRTDIKSEFSMFSFCYASGFSYDKFLAMEDPAEAALAFAKVYERCGSGSYGLRKQAAVKAYNYFCS